jgi:peptidyl-prolyl cis-trans isomerase SurA
MKKNNFIKISKICLIFWLSLLNFTSNAFGDEKFSKNFVVAKINNHIITNLDVTERYNFILLTIGLKIGSVKQKSALINQIINKMIDEELITQESEKLNIKVSAAEIEEVINDLANRQNRSLKDLKNNLAKKNLSFENYRKQIKTDLLWSKIISEVVRPKVKISNLEIRELLEEKNIDSKIDKFFIAQIFIEGTNNSSLEVAKKLTEELKKGANFTKLVTEFSTFLKKDRFMINSGEIGWVEEGDIDVKIYKAIKSLEKNQYTNPILLADGYYIFKLIDKKTVNLTKDADKDYAINAIFNKKIQILAKDYLNDLRKKSFIEINDYNLGF